MTAASPAPSADLFSVVANALERSLQEDLRRVATGRLDSIYSCAVVHALRDLQLVSGAGQFGEEDRTASLVGHWSSHLSWYLAMSQLSKRQADEPCVAWAYQSKATEAKKGGDFGLAIGLQDGTYNIAFFQAKKADLREGKTVDLWRAPSSYRKVTAKQDKDLAEKRANAADKALESALSGKPPAVADAKLEHQFVKLTAVDRQAGCLGKSGDWVHYVFWPIAQALTPRTCNLRILLKHLQPPPGATPCLRERLVLSTGLLTDTFVALLLGGSRVGAAGWLQVSEDDAEALVGEMTKLGASVMIVERSGGGLADRLNEVPRQPGDEAPFVESSPALPALPAITVTFPTQGPTPGFP